MPPVLDPSKSKVDGLAFLGLSLSRKSEQGHPDSVTRQTAFDLNEVQDRDYKYIFATNDDGWLVGGGEPGPPQSYKLAAKDSAHVEIMRIGTYRPEWGGVSQEDIVRAINSGRILIPQVEVVPTAVVANRDTPPELEIRFDMDSIPDFDDMDAPLPVNWQLRFIHNQLFKFFEFPSRFCPGAFHSTILRKAEFRSREHKDAYFQMCDDSVAKWRSEGPKPLNNGGWDANGEALERSNEGGNNSGIYLFTDRNTVTHYFKPNFLPPYDTPEKREIIFNYLEEEWDEKFRAWKYVENTVDRASVQKTEQTVETETSKKMSEFKLDSADDYQAEARNDLPIMHEAAESIEEEEREPEEHLLAKAEKAFLGLGFYVGEGAVTGCKKVVQFAQGVSSKLQISK